MAKKPHPIDVHVGNRIRVRRKLLGLSQEKLGNAIGLTFQQIQKYERGTNRVGSSRLFQIAKVLNVPVSFFFDDMPPSVSGKDTNPNRITDPFTDNLLAKRETLDLVRGYYRIPDATVRRHILELVKSLGVKVAIVDEKDGTSESSGCNLTKDSRGGFPPARGCASLRYAQRSGRRRE